MVRLDSQVCSKIIINDRESCFRLCSFGIICFDSFYKEVGLEIERFHHLISRTHYTIIIMKYYFYAK